MRRGVPLLVIAALAVGAVAWLATRDRAPDPVDEAHSRAPASTREGPSLVGTAAAGRAPAGTPAPLAPGETPPAASGTPADAAPPEPGIRVRFRIRLPSGEIPQQARVLVGGEDLRKPAAGRAWSPTETEIELPPRTGRVAVAGGRMGEWWAGDVPIPGAGHTIDVVLEGRRCIVGRVIFADGDAPLDTMVRATLVVGPGKSQRDPAEEHHVLVEYGSWFRIDLTTEPAGPESYQVEAAGWRYGPAQTSARVVVHEDPVEVELQLPPRDRTQGIELRVSGPDGTTIRPSGLLIQVQDERGNGGSGPTAFEALADGAIWVPTRLPRFSGSDPTKAVVTVFADQLGQQRVALELTGPKAPAVVTFVTPGTVRLLVKGSLPGSKGQLRLCLRPAFGRGTTSVAGATQVGETPAFELPPTQPGTYRLLWSQQRSPWSGGTELGDVEIRSGAEERSLQLPAFSTVQFSGRGFFALHVRATDGAWTTWTISGHSRNERWSIDGPPLPPGAYEVEGGGTKRVFQVPGTTEIALGE